jgi:hypothetical protein
MAVLSGPYLVNKIASTPCLHLPASIVTLRDHEFHASTGENSVFTIPNDDLLLFIYLYHYQCIGGSIYRLKYQQQASSANVIGGYIHCAGFSDNARPMSAMDVRGI